MRMRIELHSYRADGRTHSKLKMETGPREHTIKEKETDTKRIEEQETKLSSRG